MRINRLYTTADTNVYSMFEYEKRDVRIEDHKTGKVVFEQQGVEVPKQWSQAATDILASKYFRRKGVPDNVESFKEYAIPQAEGGREHSIRQIVHRLVYTWMYFGMRNGLLKTTVDAQAYYDEMAYQLLSQMGAPNTPQWFNTGLGFVYGIYHPAQGQYFYVDELEKPGQVITAENIYERQQVSACFIQGLEDNMLGPDGIYDLLVKEARMFALGSGTGTNFSHLRGFGEPLSHGGSSSGLMSFLRIFDRSADSVKSGGKTRRAAKMVIVNADHPEIIDFINWKSREEDKALALIKAGYENHYEGEAYKTISGQNSNNSVRFTHKFFDHLSSGTPWPLVNRVDGKVFKEIAPDYLWDEVCKAAWRCADPGLQFHDTINEWHTAPEDGEIEASNPCSEYMYLNETSCNLASLRLAKFWSREKGFDIRGYLHACRIWTITLELSVSAGLFPSKGIALGTYNYRTLGLGVADLGGLLMKNGIPYDSKEGRAIGAALMAILTGEGYATSAEMAEVLGPYSRYKDNREHHLRVIRNHARAASGATEGYEELTILPQPLRHNDLPEDFRKLSTDANRVWSEAYNLGAQNGFRNAQVSVIAPTGTIGLLMDCDTLSTEPDFALKKFKKLAGGGSMVLVNQAVRDGLESLGYTDHIIDQILTYVGINGHLEGSLLQRDHLSVFDCSVNAPGSERFIHYMGHLEMMGALQPFVSGAISKTVNLPNTVTPELIGKVYTRARDLMIKAVALYRDGCKSSQPLNVEEKDEPTTLPTNEGRVFPPDTVGLITEEPSMMPFGTCPHCGLTSDAMIPAGTCKYCPQCGNSSGCS